MLINAELNVPMDDIHVYIVAHVDDSDGDLNVHMFMFILMLRWVDEKKEQEEVEALREEVSGKNHEFDILKYRMRMRRIFVNQEQS